MRILTWTRTGVLLGIIAGLTAGGGAVWAKPVPSTWDRWRAERERMVSQQIEARGVRSPEVLRALRSVPRHLFILGPERWAAYEDSALPIGYGQTISQPYIVALMTECLAVKPGDTVFEVGTGSGYQAAVLAELGAKVVSVEIVEPLAKRARGTLEHLKYTERVRVLVGDGFVGRPELAPFDGILITCAVKSLPPPLVDQLKPGGRIVAPLGESLKAQTLTVATKAADGSLSYRSVTGVLFVPMTGPHEFESQ